MINAVIILYFHHEYIKGYQKQSPLQRWESCVDIYFENAIYWSTQTAYSWDHTQNKTGAVLAPEVEPFLNI